MKIGRKLNDLDASLGLAPRSGESWLAFTSRGNPRHPLRAALAETGQRLAHLERRVAELEAKQV